MNREKEEICLPNKVSLLDAQILEVSIKKADWHVDIEILLELRNPMGSFAKILFKKVNEYSFYWNSNNTFYIISKYKFFKQKSMFYISLDPDESDDFPLESDQDCILSEGIVVFFRMKILIVLLMFFFKNKCVSYDLI